MINIHMSSEALHLHHLLALLLRQFSDRTEEILQRDGIFIESFLNCLHALLEGIVLRHDVQDLLRDGVWSGDKVIDSLNVDLSSTG